MDVFELYQRENVDSAKKFNSGISSKMNVSLDYEQGGGDLEWLDIMENTIRYLDNILRNPNKFIVNEEDVIKIELAKRVTVESIKHLSRNTNLIQDIDKKTGDVKPSKILNISKEESFDTYENRLIYSLIQNMKLYIAKKKKEGNFCSIVKNKKRFDYRGSSLLGKEKVNMNLSFDSEFNDGAMEGEEVSKRIETLELRISELCNSDVYKCIDKLHISLVRSPIKKTNVIIKNVNFQYAMKLWTFLESNMGNEAETKKEKKEFEADDNLKGLVDDTFFLNYLISRVIDGDVQGISKEELSKQVVKNMVSNLTNLDGNLDLTSLEDLVREEFMVVKYRNVVSDKPIQKIFKDAIDSYLYSVSNLKI